VRGNSPVERAATVYTTEPCARTFRQDLEFYLINGWVISTPSVFVMARPVLSSATQLDITGQRIFTETDAWLIYLLAGDITEAWRYLPYELPKIILERKNVLRCWDLSAFRNRSNRKHKL